MNASTDLSSRFGIRNFRILLPIALGLPLGAHPAQTDAVAPCAKWAGEALRSCKQEASSDLWLARAKCTNLPTSKERMQCAAEALEAYEDALELCDEIYEEELEVCMDLGGGIYHPVIDPDDFVPVVDNPYFPLLPGTTFIFEKETEEGTEVTEVTVTHETKEILGVTCTEVRDTVSLDGDLIEDTLDWFAQDIHGNVWYFGELAMNYENGELVDLHGSWEAGVDDAKPGFIMEAAPRIGDFYRQEFLIREAEDVAEVESLSAFVNVPYGSFANCLKTEDFTALEPDTLENKFYAQGFGLVLTVDTVTGERTELVSIQTDW